MVFCEGFRANCFQPLLEITINPLVTEKVKIVVLALFTNIIVRINPVICTAALSASFFGGREVSQWMTAHFFNDLSRNPYLVTSIVSILAFAAPHFAVMATSAIYCIWAGSTFKMYLRNELV